MARASWSAKQYQVNAAVDKTREGFKPPLYCPRTRTDCQSVAQIISVGHVSFICCGERLDDPAARSVFSDSMRYCHKTADGVDLSLTHDRRDMAHIAAVYSMALAVVMPEDPGYEPPRADVEPEGHRP